MARIALICEPMFLARYAEKAGSGILDMIALCREAGLPEPDFRQDGGQFDDHDEAVLRVLARHAGLIIAASWY